MVRRKWVNKSDSIALSRIFFQWEERNGMRAGRELRLKGGVLWLGEIKCFYTNENNPSI